jgi:hypothetical protein
MQLHYLVNEGLKESYSNIFPDCFTRRKFDSKGAIDIAPMIGFGLRLMAMPAYGDLGIFRVEININ